MTDAQLGLTFAVPIIVGFAIMLHHMRVLQLAGTISAVVFSVAIGVVLFLTQ